MEPIFWRERFWRENLVFRMVRSILFTGDCAAARAVHDKRAEERRAAGDAEAGSCSRSGGAVAPGASKSRLRRATGTGVYAASVNPSKRAINEWLARLASSPRLCAEAPAATWVLALETRDLLTVTSLVAAGFRMEHIVVPNPSQSEVEAMHGEVSARPQARTASHRGSR
jgi:hypothetical protein